MIAIGFGLLALFAIISFLLKDEDPRPTADPRDDASLWVQFAHR